MDEAYLQNFLQNLRGWLRSRGPEPRQLVLERRRSVHRNNAASERSHDLYRRGISPVPQLSLADVIHERQALRRNRLLATGLLALMIAIAIATRFVPSSGWLVQLVRAGAEAGIIGGLADWFPYS